VRKCGDREPLKGWQGECSAAAKFDDLNGKTYGICGKNPGENRKDNKMAESRKCPRCGSVKIKTVGKATKVGTALGAGLGGFAGLLAKRGIAVVGAAAGGFSGGLMGLISGAILGNTIGGAVDEMFTKSWSCEDCGHEFK